ncbi:MAG: arginase family protein, partial [Deltaproteobacteria bacterium]|nr:arginase family protein [Deltaproteobacteria bacterium]
MEKYKPADATVSPRFCGVRTFMRLPHKAVLTSVDFIMVGIPFDTGASFRVGARFGPQAIRDASILLRPYNPVLNVNIFDHCSGVDYGDIDVVPGYIEETYKKIHQELVKIFEAGVVPIFLGGDHSITLPELRALAESRGPAALVHFDSHSDTWDSYFDKPYNHGTPFRRAIEESCLLVENSIQIGMRGPLYDLSDLEEACKLGLEVLPAWEVRKIGLSETIKRIRARVQDKPVF